jgi:hypothetical protein
MASLLTTPLDGSWAAWTLSSSNFAFLLGGGVWVQRGAPRLHGNRIMNNHSVGLGQDAHGGGVQLENTQVALMDNVFARNVVSGMEAFGGRIASFNVADLGNTTVSNNASADGAGFFNANTVNTVNSLIALNVGDNCLGVLNSGGNYLEDGGTCVLSQATDMSNTLPSMNQLGDNGGATPTHALATDQRGVPQPVDGDGDGQAVCDIGAFEFQIATTTAILSDEPDASQAG